MGFCVFADVLIFDCFANYVLYIFDRETLIDMLTLLWKLHNLALIINLFIIVIVFWLKREELLNWSCMDLVLNTQPLLRVV